MRSGSRRPKWWIRPHGSWPPRRRRRGHPRRALDWREVRSRAGTQWELRRLEEDTTHTSRPRATAPQRLFPPATEPEGDGHVPSGPRSEPPAPEPDEWLRESLGRPRRPVN